MSHLSAPVPLSGRRGGLIVATVLLAVVAAAVVGWGAGAADPPASGQGGQGADDPAAANHAATRLRAAAGRRLIAAVQLGWSARDGRSFANAVADSARGRQAARETWQAWQDLHVDDLRLRWVRAVRPPPGQPAGSAAALLRAQWTQPGWPAPAATELTVVFSVGAAPGSPDGRLVDWTPGIVPTPAPMPVWAMGRLAIASSAADRVVSLPGSLRRTLPPQIGLPGLVRQAHRSVSALVPGGDDRVQVVLADRTGQFRALLGQPTAGGHQSVAAVTTTVGRSANGEAAVQVVLNPDVVRRLRPAAFPVVLAHEITHAVTGAATVPMPLWVAEGFADFVALHAHPVPVRTAAAGALAQVRRHGPPRSLPGNADLAPGAPGADRFYELAWLAVRSLHHRVGTSATAAFHQAVAHGQPVGDALRQHAGLSLARLTAAWRADIARLADDDH